MSNYPKMSNRQEMDNAPNLSAAQHLHKSRQIADLDLETMRSRFLRILGLKSEHELWIGRKLNPALIDHAYHLLNRPSMAGRKKSRTAVCKAMRDAIRACEFAPC